MIAEDLMHQCSDEISAMSEADRCALLDPICAALHAYKKATEEGGYICPNRIVALLAVKIMAAHDKIIWERD